MVCDCQRLANITEHHWRSLKIAKERLPKIAEDRQRFSKNAKDFQKNAKDLKKNAKDFFKNLKDITPFTDMTNCRLSFYYSLLYLLFSKSYNSQFQLGFFKYECATGWVLRVVLNNVIRQCNVQSTFSEVTHLSWESKNFFFLVLYQLGKV